MNISKVKLQPDEIVAKVKRNGWMVRLRDHMGEMKACGQLHQVRVKVGDFLHSGLEATHGLIRNRLLAVGFVVVKILVGASS